MALTPPVEGVDSVSVVRAGIIDLRNEALSQGAFQETVLLSHAAAWLSVLEDMEKAADCVCNVGVQECPVHPERLWDQERKIAFRKTWDEKVVKEA